MLGGIYEVSRCDGLRYCNIHTKFHKDWFRHSTGDRGGGYTDTQTGCRSYKPTLRLIKMMY
jgi:hypothetical protein